MEGIAGTAVLNRKMMFFHPSASSTFSATWCSRGSGLWGEGGYTFSGILLDSYMPVFLVLRIWCRWKATLSLFLPLFPASLGSSLTALPLASLKRDPSSLINWFTDRVSCIRSIVSGTIFAVLFLWVSVVRLPSPPSYPEVLCVSILNVKEVPFPRC